MYRIAQSSTFQRERGATLVEAALILPLFLAILFISIQLMLVSYRLLRFQYEVAEATRQTFTLNSSERGNIPYVQFLQAQLIQRAQAAGMSQNLASVKIKYETSPLSSAPSTAAPSIVLSQGCGGPPLFNPIGGGPPVSNPPSPGSLCQVSVTVQETLFNGKFLNIGLPAINITARGIAFVQQQETE